ncbi:hypothetical protein GCM10010499_09970 [Streptomyces thermoviolaceus subsp. apingens]|nr:hypothetical protein GCM10010499_09970 [Streptomyces thermoviolaceus subsp. apingens]
MRRLRRRRTPRDHRTAGGVAARTLLRAVGEETGTVHRIWRGAQDVPGGTAEAAGRGPRGAATDATGRRTEADPVAGGAGTGSRKESRPPRENT